MHLNLLVLCVVLSQAFIGTISSENISESSGLLLRKKRVINLAQDADVPVKAGSFPYVVNIELHNTTHCVGSILSPLTIITSAFCASAEISAYTILSGSIYSFRGTARNVVDKKIRLGNHVGTRASDGIALMIVNLPLTSRFTGSISLHTGPILPGVLGTVAGWGCYYIPRVRGTQYPRRLRSMTAPLMPHRDCQDAHRGIYDITDEDVCIYDEQQHCGDTDNGAPLVIDGQLAGVFIRRIQRDPRIVGHRNPEIFVFLQHAHYNQWIRENIVHMRTN